MESNRNLPALHHPNADADAAAVLRRPGRLFLASAARMARSVSAGIGERPSRFPSSFRPRKARSDPLLDQGALELGKARGLLNDHLGLSVDE